MSWRPGKWRGGIGTIREFTFLADGGFSVEGEGHKYRPWGFLGGAEGKTASLKLIGHNGGETDLVSKVPYHKVKAGDHLVSLGPCGGGYGDPFERDPRGGAFGCARRLHLGRDGARGIWRGHRRQGDRHCRDRDGARKERLRAAGRDNQQRRQAVRAIVLNPPGSSEENMVVTDVPEPKPGEGEAVIAVSHAGCNFADTMMRRGTYPHPKGYPLVAGLEIAGTVAAVGPNVNQVKVGDRVAAFSEDAGGFAERCVIRAERLVRLPDGIGFDVAAAFFVQALTAWHMLHTVSTTKAGETWCSCMRSAAAWGST